ncbi:hypothetical protein ACB098_05G154600 [Castanea mollissima]
MKKQIENITKLGRIFEEISKEHKGFNEWILVASRRDHQTILRILIDRRDFEADNIQEQPLPTLVYLARAMNSIEVCNEISIVLYIETKMEMPRYDGNGSGCFYIGTGRFHRRETLSGQKYSKNFKADWKRLSNRSVEKSTSVLEEKCKVLASSSYEKNSQWGKEMGLKSIYFNPKRKSFLGVALTTLLQSLGQHNRWSEGDFHIFASRNCPFVLGYKKIPLKLQLPYCIYLIWALNYLTTLYYICISLFPHISSSWVLAFAFVIFLHRTYSLGEFNRFGGTTTSYFFGLLDYILKRLGFSKSAFVITTKVANDDFGTSSPMFTILATLAVLIAFCFFGALKRVIAIVEILFWERFALQILLCGLLVLVNLPVYQGLFFGKDVASLPTSVTFKSTMFALLACAITLY